ncbi:MAG: hypothetical protein ACKO1M_08055 [Planctomycetota bacterium]
MSRLAIHPQIALGRNDRRGRLCGRTLADDVGASLAAESPGASLAIDRVLDMGRTAVTVWSDAWEVSDAGIG